MPTPLPLEDSLDGDAAGFNQGVFKQALRDMRAFLAGLLGTTGNPEDALDGLKIADPRLALNLEPTFGVAASALTVTLKGNGAIDLAAGNPAYLAQRHATIGNGGHLRRKITANLSLVVSSGSTLGHTAGKLCPIYIYVIDNAGAQKLAVSGTFQGESGLYTTVAEGGAGAADNPDVMYSDAVYADKAGRLVAVAWSNQAAAGTWAANPTEVKQAPFHLERVGEEVVYMGGTVPYGFLACDGSNISRATYAKLFAKVGTTWGVGDGATTFGLPDSRRRVAVGSGGAGTGTLGNAVGNTGGEETHVLTLAESPAHTHLVGAAALTSGNAAVADHFAGNAQVNSSSAGGDGAHNNMQPSMVVTKMIRWLGDI